MTSARPMLGELTLETVQRIETEEGQALERHQVPALEGDFLQRLGRRGTRVAFAGVVTGPGSAERLAELRAKVRRAEPVPFVSDVATATRLREVLVEELDVREVAGKPERFEVALALRELTEPPAVEEEEPPEIPEEPPLDDPIERGVGTLVVEVRVEGDEAATADFDFGRVTVSARCTGEDGEPLSRTLENREGNVWTETDFPAAEVTVEAIATSSAAMVASAAAAVLPGATTQVVLTLRPGTLVATAFVVHFHFDNSFVEPCMRPVLEAVAERAGRAGSTEKVVIVGHTDKTGPEDYNQSLSERRARAVFAFLTFGRDQERAVAEWTALRQRRPAGVRKTEKDSWGVREYQFMLQDLGFYPGRIDGDHGDLTDDAVRSFRCKKGLIPGTTVDDAVWTLLIEDYLGKDGGLGVAADRFLRNAKGSCDSGRPLEWLGCGEEQPLPEPRPTRATAHRPYRRTEILFVTVDVLPCDLKEPDTFKLPPSAAGQPEPTWCLADPGQGRRCCFATRKTEEAVGGRLLIENAETGTITVQGKIEKEDGTGFGGKSFVLIAPDGRIKKSESSTGEPQPDKTRPDGTFSYDQKLPVGVYALEVREDVLVRLKDAPESSITGNSVCQALRQDSDRLNVVVSSAPLLREIKLPVVAHLMTALHPTTREVRTCPDPLDPNRRHPQATRHAAAAVRRFVDGSNDVWRQARVRLDPVRVVEEVYAFRTECEVDSSEFAILLDRCAYPNVVNVFFFGDLQGQVEAGLYVLATVTDPRGTVDGCAVTDRFNFVIFQPPILVDLDDAQTTQVVAHELGHFLGLDHVGTPSSLMRESSPDGADRALSKDEVKRARRSCNAALDCVPLRLEVRGATRVGVEGSHEHIVLRRPGGVVTVEALISAPLLAVGTLEVTGGQDGATPTQKLVPTDATGVTQIFAVFTPATGGGAPTCTPNAAAGTTPAPVARRMVTRAVVRVATFELRVEGATRAGGAGSNVFIAGPDPAARITVVAVIDPAPFCVPKDLVTWSGGDPVPDPLRRTVSRGAVTATTVQATLAGTTRTVEIRIVQVGFSSTTDPFGPFIAQVRIEGILNRHLSSVDRADFVPEQRGSLFHLRADLPGVPAATTVVTATLTSRPAAGADIETRIVTLTRRPAAGHHFVSLPILTVPRAIERARITFRAPADMEVVRAAAAGNLAMQVTADVPLGALGVAQVGVRGLVIHLFARPFTGSGITVADFRRQRAAADRAWAQAGIEVRERSAAEIAPPFAGILDLAHTDNTGQNLTVDQRRLVGAAAPSPPASGTAGDLNVYYVRSIQGPPSGIAFPNHPVIALEGADALGTQRTTDLALAHEIGHQIIDNWGGDEHQEQTAPPRDWPAGNVLHPQDTGGSDVERAQVQNILTNIRLANSPFVRFDPP